jgi:hypothetical protein
VYKDPKWHREAVLPYVEVGKKMLWYCTVMMLLLTLFAIWYGRELKAQKDSAHLGKVMYLAAIVGAIGTLCFLAAALI